MNVHNCGSELVEETVHEFDKESKFFVVLDDGSAFKFDATDGLLELMVEISGSEIDLIINGSAKNLVRWDFIVVFGGSDGKQRSLMMIDGDVALRCSTITWLTSGLLFGTFTELLFDIVAFDVLL